MEPAGIVMSFAGSTAPEGYLLCDGAAVSRSDYATLFEVIGTTYGAGDGSTTFNLPDLTGRVVIGVSGTHALASTGGSETVTLSANELPAHNHEVPQHGHGDDIAAKTPVLSHSITQPVFKYNSPKSTTRATGGYSGNSCNSTSTQTATRSTNVAITAHAAANCTTTGSVSDLSQTDSSEYGGQDAHDNMQPFISINYVISVGA